MAIRHYKPTEIAAKLRHIEVRLAQEICDQGEARDQRERRSRMTAGARNLVA